MTTLTAQVQAPRAQHVSRRSTVLLTSATVLGLLHHTDHVLRGDHSGWPFTPYVTPFTFSLIVYVFLLLAFLVRDRPARAAGYVSLVLGLTQYSHLVFELPHHQYTTWASGTNNVGVVSPALGYGAATLSILLSVVLLATLTSLLNDARVRQ